MQHRSLPPIKIGFEKKIMIFQQKGLLGVRALIKRVYDEPVEIVVSIYFFYRNIKICSFCAWVFFHLSTPLLFV